MGYNIQITDDAKNDLKSIYNYISLVLQVPQSAKNILQEITNKIDDLDESPEKYIIYPFEPLKTMEIRSFIVKKYYLVLSFIFSLSIGISSLLTIFSLLILILDIKEFFLISFGFAFNIVSFDTSISNYNP